MILQPSKIKLGNYFLIKWKYPTENVIIKITKICKIKKYLQIFGTIVFNSIDNTPFPKGLKYQVLCDPEYPHVIFGETEEDLYKILIFE